jgi:hypothetical protein
VIATIRIYWSLLVVVLLLGVVSTATSPPLSDVHGDSPIYVYEGKRFAETDFLADYHRSASTIAANAHGATLGDARFWSPYWHFTRLGHVILVGSIVAIFGSGIPAVVALQWIFAGLISGAVLLSVVNCCLLADLLEVSLAREKILLGGIASATLFVLSDIFGYLGRSFVSETPTVAVLAAAAVAFELGQKRRSLGWSAASGILAFSLYVVRAEAIWPFLVFLAVLAGSQWALGLANRWRRGYLAALITALVGWVGYAVWMYPLPDPRLFLALAGLSDIDPDEASVQRLSESIGLLLVGVILSFAIRGRRRTWAIPLIWSALALLPSIPYLVEGRSVQTRMFVPYLMLPAFVASTFGWAKLISAEQRRVRRISGLLIGAAAFLLIAISVPPVYEFTRSVPGFWRVQAVAKRAESWLRLPAWEKHTYDPKDLSEAALAVEHDGRSGPVVADVGVPYGNLYLLRFFMEPYPASSRLVMQGEPVSHLSTCPSETTLIERHRYCAGLASSNLIRLIHETGGLYLTEALPGRPEDDDLYREFGKNLVYAGRSVRVWYVAPNRPNG